ncbi:uncharacterized protein [Rutidosis leptorrhynchoides]|uniref:uncharacterized protein n=1 Tax=Rutidosis leptorrhynchoides TaxID=125765 RepID=UPI003A9A5772
MKLILSTSCNLTRHSGYPANFICEPPKKLDQAISNPTSLTFGLQTEFENITSVGFPQHFFEFKPYSQLKLYSITDYICCIQHVGEVQHSTSPYGEIKLCRSIDIINLSYKTKFEQQPLIRLEQPNESYIEQHHPTLARMLEYNPSAYKGVKYRSAISEIQLHTIGKKMTYVYFPYM